ncbi:MAG: FkbM family methyltransferase [Bacteroidetes bacterium]|nr:FkbM family methyltransferase [Bacteroidota bacterium]
MGKIRTFLKYTKDFLKHGEYRYVLSSVRYVLLGKTTRKTRYYKSSLGKFLVRKGTLDFQFGNYAYEWGVKKFVYKHIHDYNVFLDVGANIGTYSILLANKGLTGFAFEPVISNFDALITNLKLNKIEDKVVAYPFGLGEKKRNVGFTFDPVNTGASHLTENSDFLEEISNPEFVNVEIVRFDDIIHELNIKPDDKVFMKIDVEGMEPDVILGAVNFIKNHPNLLIVIESVHSGNEKLKELFSSIADFEFLEVDELNMAAKKNK